MKRYFIIASALFLATVGTGCVNTQNTMNNKQQNTNQIVIDIWSDVVCPFCYVGKKKLEKAIEELDATERVKVNWHSFQLDPQFPIGESMSTTEYLVERKGYQEDQVVIMQKQVTDLGKQYGINFQFDKAKSFNTGRVHRLIHWAKKEGKSNELKENLMLAYFTKGLNLNEESNILSVISETGLDATEAKEILTSNAFETEVKNDSIKAQQMGIRGVPFFLINGKEVISGAQQDLVFINTLKSALADTSAQSNNSLGEVCLPDGTCK